MAFTTVSPVIGIFAPGCFNVVSSPTCQPENCLFSGAVNVFAAGNSYSVFTF